MKCGENMDKFIIKGGKKLQGSVFVSASKNAYLPILAFSNISFVFTNIIITIIIIVFFSPKINLQIHYFTLNR